ncbi:limbic system-associated membrane protein-like isoform X2 [Anthonomus grandis grandis]|uniref:limbic system-associated membrane protein-like isoform X2 n=1 Tax=Anthonomus grandis grandis TaxID=2921223 RepID=UPI0021650DFD|nr:limbic system-associated membrane protein-like isoform X2 [Anthonomus grandis grandis]
MQFLIFIVFGATLFKDSWQATKIKSEPAIQPSFISSSQVFKVKDQDTVVLPCEVANPGPYVLVWKRGIAVLSAGKTLVSPDPRVTLNPDFSLEIKEVGPQDAGDYVCQIGTLQPKEITHTVEILVPPRIHYITSNGRVEVKKGSSVRMECKASGNPVPKVTWSRKNNLLPGGEQSIISPALVLDKVDRHHAGVYQCVANNGVGEEVKEQIYLHVLYPPEITVERPVVYSGEGMEAQLVCIVHGESQPEVLWYRDTMQLDTTERRIMESRGSRHTLVIRKVNRQDFGNYTCVADNQLGKTRKSIQLTGKPHPVKFNSPTTSRWKQNYNISWEVESLSPIEEYKLLYRKLPEVSVVTGDNQPQPLHHQSQKKLNQRGENRTYSITNFGHSRPMKDWKWNGLEWRDVILPAIPAQPVGMQFMSYDIRGLEPGQQYEARVQARNKFGWSPESPSFIFKTTETENAIEDVLSVKSRNGAQEISNLSYLVVLSFVFMIFYNN